MEIIKVLWLIIWHLIKFILLMPLLLLDYILSILLFSDSNVKKIPSELNMPNIVCDSGWLSNENKKGGLLLKKNDFYNF